MLLSLEKLSQGKDFQRQKYLDFSSIIDLTNKCKYYKAKSIEIQNSLIFIPPDFHIWNIRLTMLIPILEQNLKKKLISKRPYQVNVGEIYLRLPKLQAEDQKT